MVHVQCIEEVLKAAALPTKLAIIHVEGHQRVKTFEGEGNTLADEEAKNSAEDKRLEEIMYLPPTLELVENPVFSVKEEEELKW